MKQAFLECGKIINTHGFRGTVKLESRCDSPYILAELETLWFYELGEYRPRRVLHASVFRQFVLADIEGVDSEEKANALRNRIVYAAREDIPLEEGDCFIVDLIGLPVIDDGTGREYGKLKEVINRGASDIYVIDTPAGERMMPAVEEFVKRIDFENGIYISPIEGMLD